MEEENIYIEKIESFYELENKIDKEQLVLCDNVQNAFVIIHLKKSFQIGIAYYDYGIPIDFQFSKNNELLYLGVGKNFLCIDMKKNRILINNVLQSVFYELLCDLNKNYICVICELDVYCYYLKKQQWRMGFRDIVVDYSIINDKLSILCDDGRQYMFYLESGKIV